MILGVSLKQLLTIFVVSPLLFVLTVYAVTSIVIQSWAVAIAGVLLIQLFQVVCQVIVSKLIRVFGVFILLINCFIGYGLALWIALLFLPGFETVTLGESIMIAWLYALIVTIIQWAFVASSDDFLLEQFIRTSKKSSPKAYDSPGFIFVQLDGVSSHLLDWQLKTGNMPNIGRLVQSGEYAFETYRTQIPSTTPASQAGLLFGTNDQIPAFRWYERQTGKLIVANQQSGAQLIEKRLSTGNGLLADGGVSLGNLFSGDAAESIMVMSKLQGNTGSKATMGQYSRYLSSPHGFMRLFILSLGEVVKEIFQARHQRIKNITPRVDRHASYMVLRAATNVFLRELQTTIVLDKMSRGVNSLYVDYLDYDEIAHHAGIARPESLDALSGLDKVAGILTKAATYAMREYHVVFVSDHGQSQGQTFLQLNNGTSLESVLANTVGTNAVQSDTDESETYTAVRNLASQQKQFRKIAPQATRSSTTLQSKVVVTGSGNLGNVWLTEFTSRPTKEQLEQTYPQLIPKLLATPGIGLILVHSKKQGPIAIGKEGTIQLETATVTGKNPLASYPSALASELLRLRAMKNTPDITIISSYDPSTGEVHAFEELVGNHGGIGGWQTDALLLHPKSLRIKKRFYTDGKLINSTTIHNIFIDWMKDAGQRKA